MKIAIIRLSALGDIIQSAVILQFIKGLKKDIELHWFVDEKFKDILENHPLIDRLYALPLKDKKIYKTLKILFKARKNRYDFALDLQGLIKSALTSRILSPNNFGFDKFSLKESFASIFYHQKFAMSYNENVFVRYLSLSAFMLNAEFEPKDIYFKQAVFNIDKNITQSLFEELEWKEKNILLHVGSSEKNKIYPKEKLIKLCSLITQDETLKIFLCWGNDFEKEMAKEIAKTHQNIEVLRKMSLKELIALTKMMDLIIGNDSGPTHLAFAMNKASITIFGATPSKRNSFETSINKTIDAGKKITNAKHINKKDFCITQINERDIFALVKELLYV